MKTAFKHFNALSSLILLLVLISSFPVQAQTIGPNRVLVRNVTLFDPTGAVEDKVVNILLRDNKLDIVTEDKLSRDDADMVVNARNGLLMGKLTIGQKPSFIIFEEDPRENFQVLQKPSFIIFEEDPRENFQVLLDTFSYSIFAVDDGVVVKNHLVGVVADEPDEEPTKTSWLAYTPPPLMMPLDYHDASKWNRFETRYINGIFVSALVLDRIGWTRMRPVKISGVISVFMTVVKSGVW